MSEIDDLIASVDAVNVRGRHVERIYKGGSLVRDHVTNLFTNPNLVGDGTWAEVRRNLVTVPLISTSLSGWALRAPEVSDGGAVAGTGRRLDVSGAVVNNSYLLSTSPPGAVAPGEKLSGSFSVLNSGSSPIKLKAGIYCVGPNTYVYGPDVTIAAGTYGVLSIENAEIPAGTTSVAFRVISAGVTAGQQFTVTDFTTLEKAQKLGVRFTGSGMAAGVVQPEDFRVRWLGEPNESESVMEIERVAGLYAENCVAGVSSWEGKPAVRLIPTGPVLNGAVAYVPTTAPILTMVGTVSLDAPLQGTLYEHALTLDSGVDQAVAPNLAGDHPLRVIGAEVYGTAHITLLNGASLGNGDVWWTDIGVFAGEYDGEWFAGDSPYAWWLPDGTSRMLKPL